MAAKQGFKQRFNWSYTGSPIHFVDDSTIMHACGNMLCKFDIYEGTQETHVVSGGAGVGAFTLNRKQNVVCFSEKGLHPNLRFCDLENGTMLSTLSDGTDLEFADLAFSSDGALLASLGSLPDFELVIWDWSKGHALAQANLPGGGTSVSFNPDSRDELCVSGKGTLLFIRLLVDQESNVCIDYHKAQMAGDEKLDWVSHSWDKDNHVYCGSTSGQVWRFDPSSGTCTGTVFHLSPVGAAVVWLRVTAQHVIGATSDGTVRWLDVEEVEECHAIKVPPESTQPVGPAQSFVTGGLSPNGVLFVLGTGSGALYSIAMQGQIPSMLDGEPPEPCEVTTVDTSGNLGLVLQDEYTHTNKVADYHCGPVTDVVGIPGNDFIASIGADCMLRVYSIANGALVARRRFRAPLLTISNIPGMRKVVTGGEDGTLRVLEVPAIATAGEIHCPRLLCRHKLFREPCIGVSVHGSGEWIAATAAEGKIIFIHVDASVTPTKFTVVGYVALEEPVTCLGWIPPVPDMPMKLLVVAQSRLVFRITAPDPTAELDQYQIPLAMSQVEVMRTEYDIIKIVPLDAGRFWACINNSKKCVLFPLPPRTTPFSEKAVAMLTPPLGELENHLKPGVTLAASDNNAYIATASTDGVLQLYDVTVAPPHRDTRPKMQVRVQDSFKGGVAAVCFSSDSSHVCVTGQDGTCVVMGIGLARLATRKPSPDDEWLVRDDCSDGGDYEGDDEPTFLVSRLRELREVEEAVHASMKNQTRKAVSELRQKLQEALTHNEQVQSLERLQRHEFIVDLELKEELEQEGNQRVSAVVESVHMTNLGADLVWGRIKAEVWESMEAVGLCVCGFDNGVVVHNFPIKQVSEEEKKKLAIAEMLRQVENTEASNLRKEFQTPTSVAGLVLAHPSRNTAWGPPPDIFSIAEATPAKAAAAAAGAAGKDNAAAATEEVEPVEVEDGDGDGDGDPLDNNIEEQSSRLTYSRLDVTTRERRVSQSMLVKQECAEIKRRFNQVLSQTLARKQDTLSRVEERNVRILEILGELRSTETTTMPTLQDSEQPEKVLSVSESEVGVDPYASTAVDSSDDVDKPVDLEAEAAVKRALKAMMGGTLDSDKEVCKLDQVLPKPEWMLEVPPEEMTDEQIKACKEYDAADKALKEEKDKYRKTLESEMKKLRAEQVALMAAFDESLLELADQHFEVDYTVNKLELYGIKLLLGIHKEEELTMKSVKLEAQLIEAEDVVDRDGKALNDHKVKLEKQREAYEHMAAEDKALERQLRREIAEAAGEYAEVVRQAFAMRPEPESEEEWLGINEPCPFGVDEQVWERMLQGRETKLSSEMKLRAGGQALNVLQQTMQELQDEFDEQERRLVAVQNAIQSHKEESIDLGFDLDMIIYVKQGQLEVEQAAVVTDYSDGTMLERGAVEALNQQTTHHGQEKVAILQEIKEFRKGIHKLQWENRCLELEEEELVHRIRDLQLLRVTKNLQALIKGGEQGRAAAETASLEKLMEYQHQLHSDKVADNKRVLDRLESQARETLRENEELDEDVQALEAAVVERDRLCELHGSSMQDQKKGTQKQRMKVMVTHRKLLDLAKAQTREIELMREELVRLRARTFPSFAQLHDAHAYPDEK